MTTIRKNLGTLYQLPLLLVLLGASTGCKHHLTKQAGSSGEQHQRLEADAKQGEEDPAAKLAKKLKVGYTFMASPNYNTRQFKNPKTGQREGPIQLPKILVLHYTACEKKPTISTFMRPDSVSAHYLVGRKGAITHFVNEKHRAWHAGRGSWAGCHDVNTPSIGIENINLGYKHQVGHSAGIKVPGGGEAWYKYDEALLKTLGPLCADIVRRHNIKPWNVIGHSCLAPGRKVDPGPFFPWKRFYTQYGVGAWVTSAKSFSTQQGPAAQSQTEAEGKWLSDEKTIKEVQSLLNQYGYTACPQTGKFDAGTKNAVRSFQLRFRQTNISGNIDAETLQILRDLVKKYGKAIAADRKAEEAARAAMQAAEEAARALKGVEEADKHDRDKLAA